MRMKEYAAYLKDNGYYIGEDGHIRNPKGKAASILDSDGDYKLFHNTPCESHMYSEKNIVWRMSCDEDIGNKEVSHIDGDKSNNRFANLVLKEHNVSKGRTDSKMLVADKILIKKLQHGREYGYPMRTESVFIDKAMDRSNDGTDIIDRILKDIKTNDDAFWRGAIPLLYPLLVKATLNPALSSAERLSNAVMGLCGEVGEIADAVKKHFYQGHQLDVTNLIEEAGDVLYYLCLLLKCVNTEIPEAMLANMDKLKRRFPNGFDSNLSVNRKE